MSDWEDILSDSLEFLGGKRVIEDDIIRYGPLQLTVASKGEGQASVLLADHLFSPSIFLAERIERGLLDVQGKTLLELGSGAALPSLLLSTTPNPPSLIVITDHPDDGIFSNLLRNVNSNKGVVNPQCTVVCKGYAWGQDVSPLLEIVDHAGYDALILSDLLHFKDCHDILISSAMSLLKRSPESRLHVSAGYYTGAEVIDGFFAKSTAKGLEFEEIPTDKGEGWMGTLEVNTLDREALRYRKEACRYWVGRWSEQSLRSTL